MFGTVTDAMKLSGKDRAEAERILIEHHYTHSVPSGKADYYRFESCLIVFAIPANKNISFYLLGVPNKVWELARLWAPDRHRVTLLTEALSAATAAFHRDHPEIEALVSYADPNAGHHGGVYRAASWVYKGKCEETRVYQNILSGQSVARRAFHSGRRALCKAEIEALGYRELKLPGKHRFAKGLTRRARKKLLAGLGGRI